MNNAGFLSDFARLFPDLASPGGSLLTAAITAANEAGTTLMSLPSTFAFAGHSAGGGSIAWVAKELVTTHPTTGAALRGLAFLDPVESTAGALMASSLPSLAGKRLTTISSPPYSCNSSASGTALPRPFLGVELTSGCHCDAEGSSTDALCTLFCGTPQAANVSALQTLAIRWIGDFFAGGYSASYYPGGAYYESQLAPGRIRTLPDPTSCGNGTVGAGEQCDDGNRVNGDCCSGICQYEASGSACASDGNPCTTDVCNGAGVCGVANTASCSDGVFCNGADTCGGGTCSQHAGDPCLGGAECAAVCDENADACRTPAGVPCGSDDNPCTVGAEWVVFDAAPGGTIYLDPSTIHKDGNRAEMWVLIDYKTPQLDKTGKHVLSDKLHYQYDCKEKQLSIIATSAHAGPMASGETININPDPPQLTPVPEGTTAEKMWKRACGIK